VNFPTAQAGNTENDFELAGKLKDYAMRSVHSDGAISYAWTDRIIRIHADGTYTDSAEEPKLPEHWRDECGEDGL
jgi:hypothetical protein